MVSSEIELVIENLKAKGRMVLHESVTEQEIKTFEKNNDIVLPYKYKEWLQISDGGELFLPAGIQLYGIKNKPVINICDNDRPSTNYILIGALASGDPILFKKNSERIAIYNQESGRIEDDEIYDDFIAFLKDLYDLLGIGS